MNLSYNEQLSSIDIADEYSKKNDKQINTEIIDYLIYFHNLFIYNEKYLYENDNNFAFIDWFRHKCLNNPYKIC